MRLKRILKGSKSPLQLSKNSLSSVFITEGKINLVKNLKILTNHKVESVFETYPSAVRKKMKALRKLIIETARETEDVEQLEETLKWSEPSYLTKHGSTIRIDWKESSPNQYAIYFKCTSKLVPTFKKIFKETFTFQESRAIIFQINDIIPKGQLKKCIKTALLYHKVKQLPLLGLKKESELISNEAI